MEKNDTLYTWSLCDAEGNEFASGVVKRTEWVDLGLPSGTLWAACNVGANKPEEFGGYYDWYHANKLGVTLPNKAQIIELYSNCTSVWTVQNGKNGRMFTGPNGNALFLPAAGYYDASLYHTNICGYYWSGTPSDDVHDYEYYLFFDSGGVDWGSDGPDYGQSVRAVKNKDNEPNKQQKHEHGNQNEIGRNAQ